MKLRTLTLIFFVACCLVTGLSWADTVTDSMEPVTEAEAPAEATAEAEAVEAEEAHDITPLDPIFGEIDWVGPGGDCLADCRIEQQACLAGCGTNGSCISFCFSEFNSCRNSCTG